MSNKISTLKKQNLVKLKFIFIASFLLYFFSNSLIYAQSNQKLNPDYLIPIGNVVQIDAELQNIIVRNQVEGSPFILGDAILALNNTPVSNYGDLSNILSNISPSDKVSVLVRRGAHKFTLEITKGELEKININGLLSGFATLTYINPVNGEFGAVAHPISVGTSKKVNIKTGHISTTKDLIIEKSSKGCVGSINAKRKDTIGQFVTNNDFGIKGNIAGFDCNNLKSYKVANLDEVKLGKAQLILQTTSKECKKFDIQIVDIQNQRSPQSKTFRIKITDKDLLTQTGGIVQGMSGTPIVQDDKIIGAISHAVENDPSFGYAVFIQWMLEK
ncbi:MAG: SpoIVB peptidase S55 domain-containing protein [Romboutsia sp.]|uniref:SpoIVB peptidase S55 domain-containing protein n=1 Tax=Romboutsia sp. TaxID=1965302 RepID=UPI003F2CD9C9